MKNQGWNFLGTFFGLFLMATSAKADNHGTVWLARLSGQTQCTTIDERPSISDAAGELESEAKATVMSVKLASLKDRAFCNSCSCPRNLFYVAEIGVDRKAIENAQREGWIFVDPKVVSKPSLPGMVENPTL